MTTVQRVLDRARSQIGVAERPAGSNHVLYSRWYGLAGPWCAMFVSWCAFHEGLPFAATTPKGFAYTPAGARWFQQNGRWSDRPAPGHVVFFDFPGDDIHRISHVGFVESVAPDGTLTTIEGNTDISGGRSGGQVMRRRRRSGVVGYGVPAYDKRVVEMPYPGQLLQAGMKGRDVRMLQARLCQLGVASLQVDGHFGPNTDSAVRLFQARRALQVDGVVGHRTWAALWAENQ